MKKQRDQMYTELDYGRPSLVQRPNSYSMMVDPGIGLSTISPQPGTKNTCLGENETDELGRNWAKIQIFSAIIR
jgi:hypothetical protein